MIEGLLPKIVLNTFSEQACKIKECKDSDSGDQGERAIEHYEIQEGLLVAGKDSFVNNSHTDEGCIRFND